MPPINDTAVQQYHSEGFHLARGFFEADKIDLLKRAAKEDNELDKRSFGRADGEGGVVRLSLWNHPGHGIYGAFARCERMVRSCESLLGGEVYHYHSKMILKDAKIGGAWAWHQDYGYWYQNGVLEPLLTSVFLAVDPCTRENGCLQVIRHSHHCGRINHVLTGDQAGADRERVDELLKRPERFPLVHVGTASAQQFGGSDTTPPTTHHHDTLPRHAEVHRRHLSFNVVRLNRAKMIERIRNRVMIFGSCQPISSK